MPDLSLNDRAVEAKIAGVDLKDYPEFSDSYLDDGIYLDSGDYLNDSEMDLLQCKFENQMHELANESLY